MKSIVFIYLIFSLQSSLFAQTQTDPGLDKFIGNWRWVNNTDTLEIVLQKQTVNHPITGVSFETISGWHKYVLNGALQQSSINYVGTLAFSDFNNPNSAEKVTIMANSYGNRCLLAAPFIDVHLHKTFELFLTLLPNSLTQLNWDLRQPRGLYAGPAGLNGVFSLPKNLVLTKL